MHKTITVTPTIQAALYASGDLVGGKITLPSVVRGVGRGGEIQSITLSDKAVQDAAFDLVFFKADPAATTFTENSPLTVADADLLSIVGTVSIAAADYVDFAANSVATVRNVGLSFDLGASDADLYAALIVRDGPTYASVSDLQLQVTIAPN